MRRVVDGFGICLFCKTFDEKIVYHSQHVFHLSGRLGMMLIGVVLKNKNDKLLVINKCDYLP